jgi:MFS family permease
MRDVRVVPSAPAQVIRAYLAISGLFTLSASVIWGVNTLFLLDAGLDIFEVFVANAAFTAGMVLFEIPTGVVADATGRRRSFLLSAATLAVGTLAYVTIAELNGGVLPFVVASLVLGLGFSFYSGAVEAWLVDALAATRYSGHLDGVFARGAIVSGAAEIAGAVGGGLLATVDLSWPFLVRSALLVAVFVVGFFTMHDLGFVPRATKLARLPSETRLVLRASVEHGWRNRPVRLLMAVSLVQWGFLVWGFYAWQPYFLELLDRDGTWIAGLIAALIAASTIAGNTLVNFLTRFCSKRTTLLIAAAAIEAGAVIGVGFADAFWPAVALLLVAMAATGVATPVQQAYLHAVVPSMQRATVVSSVSLIASVGGIAGSLGLGYIARAQSVSAGYVVGGIFLLLALPALVRLRAMRAPADRIVGRHAGVSGPCAGQGLPPVSAIDTSTRQPVPTGL